MPSGFSAGFNFTDFHSFCSASISEGGGGDRTDEMAISEADDARERPGTGEPSDGAGIGTESTIN